LRPRQLEFYTDVTFFVWGAAAKYAFFDKKGLLMV
jgi:hypothetical protein